jgi:phosphodiesterase/alkaline phosphatase D-like protein
LGKIWERNHSSLINLRPSSAEELTKFLRCVSLILRERVRVILRQAVPAVTKTLLANLLWDAQRAHCCSVRLKTLPFVVTTLAATSITSTSAVLNGSINPNGTGGCASFEYGTDPNLTNPFGVGSFTVAANSTAQSFSTTATLSPNTTYYYAMLFSPSCSGLQVGNIVSLQTLP